MEARSFEDVLEGWDGVGVVVGYDRPSGTWIFVALHDDTRGRPVGGCRMKVYETPAAGLLDATRLARGMTHKWASIDFDFGGGKAVLAVPHPMEGGARTGLLRRFGRFLNTLQGAYATGEDMGTTPEDMRVIASETEWVMGVNPDDPEPPTDPGPFTALGVLAGIEAAVAHLDGSGDLGGTTVLIQGVGDVGDPLARLLADVGARVLVSDLDDERAAAVARAVGGEVVSPEAVYATECDVFAPCAVGAVLNRSTIPLLRCRIVAGSANNQLEEDDDAERLRERGILYAPDYVVNAGGAMAFGLINKGLTGREEIEARVRRLGETLSEIFAEADRGEETPLAAARRKVEAMLAGASGAG